MTSVERVLIMAACAATCLGIAAAPAMADKAPSNEDSQILDVSKQVSGIQKHLDDLLAHGRWATAGKLVSSADCGYGEAEHVFLPWDDDASYELAPQGDFSTTTGWTLGKGVAVVPGGDPFTGATQSLALGKDGQAATPAMCVDLSNPTIRFFARDVGGNDKADLKVDVLYEDFNGHVKHLTIAKLRAGSAWQPSVIVPFYMNVLAAASSSGVTAVAFQFKAEGLQKDESLSISSLYVDPFNSR
jgi:hypothetical protein